MIARGFVAERVVVLGNADDPRASIHDDVASPCMPERGDDVVDETLYGVRALAGIAEVAHGQRARDLVGT